MFAVVGICIIVALIPLWMIWEWLKLYQIMAKVPGPAGIPILGNALQFKRDPHDFFLQIRNWCDEYYGGMFRIWLGTLPFIVIFKPEYVEVLLSSPKILTKSRVYDLIHPWLGTGLLTSTGAKWKSRRRLLTSTFHFKVLNNYISIYQKQSTVLIEKLKANAGKAEFNIAPYITLCVLDIICETAMGVHINAQSDSESKYVKAVLSMSDLIQERQKSPWMWIDAVYKLTSSGKRHRSDLNILHGFTNKVINERITERKQLKETDSLDELPVSSAKKRQILAFLDLLLEEYDQGNITKEGIREEVDTFMFEGHDTTAASLQWTLHLIGKHPDVQSRLQKEVDNLYDSVDEVISPDQIKELHYVERVLKESLRLFPSVPLLARRVTEDFKVAIQRCLVKFKVKNLKKEQRECIEKVLFNEDVLAVLRTGYGKSLIYQLLPSIYEDIYKLYKQAREGITLKQFWIVVVSPLEYLRKQQISNLERLECAIKASSIGDSENSFGGGKRPGPYTIPKGCAIGVSSMALHRNPDAWPDPNTFDPDRFLLENCQGRHPFAYVPFSAGPRNCIGQKFAMMEEKVVLSSIVRNFNIHSTQTTEDIRTGAQLVLRSVEGIWVQLEVRREE